MSAEHTNGAALARQPLEVRRGITGWYADAQEDFLALEIPVALIYNGISHAVIMASPTDL